MWCTAAFNTNTTPFSVNDLQFASRLLDPVMFADETNIYPTRY